MSFSNDSANIVNQLPNTINLPDIENASFFQERLEELLKRVVGVINTKEGGAYLLREAINFDQYFTADDLQTLRNVYRSVINFGTLPNTGSTSVAHGLTFDTNSKLVRAYGASTDPTAIQFIPLPFSSPTLADNVSVEIDSTNVTITTGKDMTSFINTTIVLEYTKI